MGGVGGQGEVKEGGTHVYPQLTHVDGRQRPTQYCEAIFLQLKINEFGEEKKQSTRKRGPLILGDITDLISKQK